MPTKKVKISFKDYERIYKIINSIVISENGDPAHSCVLFSFYGASILKNHYGINAVPVGGACGYNMGTGQNGKPNILFFGKEGYISDEEHFHCLVFTEDGWFIDFMAPNFKNLNPEYNSIMVQKHASSLVNDISDMGNEKAMCFEFNEKVIDKCTKYLSSRIAFSDLEKICLEWFRKHPKKISKQIPIINQNGEATMVKLTGNQITDSL